MGKLKRYKNSVEKFLSSDAGQRFFNFAYSIGAAIVIWGALFKILHLPGGSTLLSIGMGTEVLMFVLTAFDRPPKSYNWEEVFPVLDSKDPEDRPDFAVGNGGVYINNGGNGEVNTGTKADNLPNVTASQARGAVGIPEGINLSEEDTNSLTDSIAKMSAAADQLSRMAELTDATQQYLSQMAGISEQMQLLRQNTENLNHVQEVLLNSYEAITHNSDEISTSSSGYVNQMQNLNRNLGGLNTIYEIQLNNISSQLANIDSINRGLKDIRDMYEKSATESGHYCSETEKMTRYMQQLNSVYEKMITAMTVNMYNPMMGGNTQPQNNQNPTQPNQQ